MSVQRLPKIGVISVLECKTGKWPAVTNRIKAINWHVRVLGVTGVARERVTAPNATKNGASSRKRTGFTTKSRYIDELEGPHHRLPWGYLRHVKPISSSMLAYGQSCFIGSPVTPAVEVSPGAMYQPCTRLRCMSPRDAFERYTSSADSPFHFSHPRTSE